MKTIYIHWLCLLLAGVGKVLLAGIIHVPAGQPTIQAGIDVAVYGDTVLVQPGTYIENLNFNGKPVMVGSLFITTGDTAYISQTIIDGNQNGSVVIFESGESFYSVLKGFTLTNGLAQGLTPYWGGGITCWLSSPTIEYMVITGNTSQPPATENASDYGGGGIYITFGTPTIKNTWINNNYVLGASGGGGGGIYVQLSNAVLEDVEVTDNYAEGSGGGIFIDSGSPVLTNVVIQGNQAMLSSGGIGVSWSNAVLTNVVIRDNWARSHGGGMTTGLGSPVLNNVLITGNTTGEFGYGAGIFCGLYADLRNCTNVTIRGNHAGLRGGGIAIDAHSDSTVYLSNMTVANNTAQQFGGGIYSEMMKPIINNLTVVGNSAVVDGGGMYCVDGTKPFLINTIIRENFPNEIFFNAFFDSIILTVSHSNIKGGQSGIVHNNNGTINWLDGNIDADPMFVDTANGNFALLPGSPCIDAGTAFFQWQGQVYLNLPPSAYLGVAPDMGAHEFDPSVNIVNSSPLLPANFQLFQNYPNPFNTGTVIEYHLFQPGQVNLALYNSLGQRIHTLVNKRQEPGQYTVFWDGQTESSLPAASGIYFYRLVVNGTTKTRRMILIR